MRILFFCESLRPGGKERRIVELIRGLKAYKNIEIELVLTRNEIHYQEIFNLNIPINFAKRRFLKKDPSVFFKFFRIASRFNPDIIHVWGHMVAVYALPAKWILKVPLLNNEITDSTPNKKLLLKNIVFNSSNKIIANSKAGLIAYNAPPAKSKVIYNGFNFSRILNLGSKEIIKKQFGLTTKYVVAMVASFSEYKDYKTYIAAALNVLEKFQNVTFLCIGDGDDSVFQKMVEDKHKSQILFLGKQSKVESIMNCSDIGVLTTNINFHGEGISNALMEFMALGKPVITTNFGGSAELVEDGVSGYLISPFDYNQLSEKIQLLLKNPHLRHTMGMNSNARISREFSIEKMVNSFCEEYQLLVNCSS